MEGVYLIILGVIVFGGICMAACFFEAITGIVEEVKDVIEKCKKRRKLKESNTKNQLTKQVEESDLRMVKYEVDRFRPCYRAFTLAGGTEPLLHPLISFKDNKITLKKHGYDINITNLNRYYDENLEWKEREKALNLFMTELFGEYSEEMSRVISFEYIADHLIQLEKQTEYNSDFYLIFSDVCSLKTDAEINLFIRKLKETKIYS